MSEVDSPRVEDGLVTEASRHPDGRYSLERPKRRSKGPIEEQNVELANSDIRYWTTLCRIPAQIHEVGRESQQIAPSETSPFH